MDYEDTQWNVIQPLKKKKKEEGNPVICVKSMDLKGILLNRICQTEKDKYCLTSLTCRISRCPAHRKRLERRLPEMGGGWGDGNMAKVI